LIIDIDNINQMILYYNVKNSSMSQQISEIKSNRHNNKSKKEKNQNQI
jgi:hypothetical protein